MIPTFHRSVINPHTQMMAQGHQATITRRTRVQREIAPFRRRSEMRGASLRIHFRGIRLPQRRGWLVGCDRDVAPAVRMCAVELGGRAWDTPARWQVSILLYFTTWTSCSVAKSPSYTFAVI